MLVYGGNEVIMMSVVFPFGLVIVLSLGYFSSVGFSYIPSHSSFLLYFGARHIQDYFNKNRERNKKFPKLHQ